MINIKNIIISASKVFFIMLTVLTGCKDKTKETTEIPIPPIGVELSKSEDVSLLRIQGGNGNYSKRDGKYLLIHNQSLKSIICYCFGFYSSHRLVGFHNIPKGKYDVKVNIGSKTQMQEASLPILIPEIEKIFGVNISFQDKMMMGYELRVLGDKILAKLGPKDKQMMSTTNLSTYSESSYMYSLASLLENHLQAPVVDQTGAKEKYTFHFKPRSASLADINDSLEHLGLKLFSKKLKTSVLVLESSRNIDKTNVETESEPDKNPLTSEF